MLYVQELKPGEIADILDKSPEYIYKLRYRAISELRMSLGERSVDGR